MKKIVRLTEGDLIRLVKRVINEEFNLDEQLRPLSRGIVPLVKTGLKALEGQRLSPEALNSPKGQWTKKVAGFFNKYYRINLPLDGNWMNPDFRETKARYLKEKGLPVYVCKKGDGYCNDAYAGEVTTKEDKKYYEVLKQDMSKLGIR